MAIVLALGPGAAQAASSGDLDPTTPTGSHADLSASEIYVDVRISPLSCTDYDPVSRECGSGASSAHRTLAAAAEVAGPGDTVLLREGTYNEALVVQQSGTLDQPVTFRSFGSEAAVITGSSLSPAVDISGRQHVVLQGLEVIDVRRWLYAVDSHNNVVRGNVFRRALDSGHSQKTGLFFQEATYNKILDNIIEDSSEDNLYLVKSDYNLVEGNEFRKAYHTLWAIKCGNYNVLRDNYFHNEDQKIGEIYDCHDVGFDREFYIYDATKHNLVEANDFAYVPSSGNRSPYSGIQYAGQAGIIRRNRFHNTVGPGLSMTLYPEEAKYNTDNRVYHNVFNRTDFAGVSISGSDAYTFFGNVFKNNIFTRSRFVANDTRWDWYSDELHGQPVQVMTGRLDGFRFDTNNLFHSAAGESYLITFGTRTSNSNPPQHPVEWWDTNHPELFANSLQDEPMFVDEASFDFHLARSSPMIDAGTFLSRAVGSGSGSVLPVDDASYFYDGYGIPGEIGDEIQLEGSAQTALVLDIDESSDVLTLDRPITWTDGQGVTLAYEGTAPDIGAFEFESPIHSVWLPAVVRD